MFEFQQEPWVIMAAHTIEPWKDAGKGRDLVKKHGFSWETPKGHDVKIEKSWVKAVKSRHMDAAIESFPFKVSVVK
jgi:elongation factor P hydroxylase